jgi:hypothetical protein
MSPRDLVEKLDRTFFGKAEFFCIDVAKGTHRFLVRLDECVVTEGRQELIMAADADDLTPDTLNRKFEQFLETATKNNISIRAQR